MQKKSIVKQIPGPQYTQILLHLGLETFSPNKFFLLVYFSSWKFLSLNISSVSNRAASKETKLQQFLTKPSAKNHQEHSTVGSFSQDNCRISQIIFPMEESVKDSRQELFSNHYLNISTQVTNSHCSIYQAHLVKKSLLAQQEHAIIDQAPIFHHREKKKMDDQDGARHSHIIFFLFLNIRSSIKCFFLEKRNSTLYINASPTYLRNWKRQTQHNYLASELSNELPLCLIQ